MTFSFVSLFLVLKKTFLLLFLAVCGLSIRAQPPTVHATSVSVTYIYCNVATISWSAGNGDSRLVFVQEGSAVDTFPTDNQNYTPNNKFGSGVKLKNAYTVFNGSGTSVTVTGLKKSSNYHVAIYEYNNNSGFYEYYTGTGFGKQNFKTETITANFSINDKYQCLSGNSYAFTNSSSNSLGVNPASMTYTWDFGDKSSAVTTQNATYSYLTGGIFQVNLTAETLGCKTDTSVTDTVVVPWDIDFQLRSLASNDSIQCFGDNYFRIVNNSIPPPKPIYGLYDRTRSVWTTSDNIKGSLFDFDFGTTKAGQITVKLIMGRQVSPGQEYCFDSFEKVYVVLPPVIDASKVSISDSILCLSENEFTYSHTGANVVSTKWYFGDNDSSSDNPATHSYLASGSYEVICMVVDANGCIDTVFDSVGIVETPDNYFTGLNAIYCEGDPGVNLRPNLSGGEFKGGHVNTMDSTFTPGVPGQYTVGYIYSLGSCRDTFIQMTEVLGNPTFSIGIDTIICSNTTIDLMVDSAGLNYRWDDGSTSQNRIIDKPGTYWVIGDDGSCDFSDSVTVIGLALPDLELGNDTSICGGEFLSYDIRSDGGSIVWRDGNTDGFKRTIVESGFYKATITHPCGVINDSINVDILPTACAIFIPNAISPNSDFLNERFYPSGLFKFISMQIWNEYGQQLFESFDEGNGWDGKVNGVVSQPGTYYFIIRYQLPENGSYVNKSASGPLFLMW
ncbi:MAG: gliding motility-associated-like protein [Bacteroidia bacterium]|jgi:gliding motility-associated-like protein